jgi:hypothetical protein
MRRSKRQGGGGDAQEAAGTDTTEMGQMGLRMTPQMAHAIESCN